MTLAEVVIRNPAAAEIFEDLNIDYFCRGSRLLGDVLNESNVMLDAFTGELARVAAPNVKQRPEPDWQILPLRNLIKHIVDKHHAYLHSELPALDRLIGRMTTESPIDDVPLVKLHKTIQRLKRELELQMRKEEAILFPAISDLDASVAGGGQPNPISQFGSVANLSRVLGQNHNKTACELDEIRELTNNYRHRSGGHLAVPDVFRRLRALALDMHKHVHLENNVLFPRAVQLEKEKAGEGCHD
jgi:regulator of cell morphogenesis and NO signaling